MDGMKFLEYFGTFGFASLIVTVWILWTIAKWQRHADTHIQIRTIPRAGKSKVVQGIVVGPMVKVEGDKKKEIPGREWPITEIATYEGDYPHDWPIAFMRRNIKEMAVYTWNWEPISNPSDDPLMSPELIYTFEQERVSATLVAVQQWLADKQEAILSGLQNLPKVKYIYMGLVIIGVAIGAMAYALLPIIQDPTILENIKMIPQMMEQMAALLEQF